MIHPNTQIQYLDIKIGEPRYKTINDLYQEYSHNAEEILSHKHLKITEINFGENDNVKITDLFGWTNVLSLRKVQSVGYHIRWNILAAANKKVLLTESELVPFYDINKHTIGFHGEIKYEYILKQLSKSLDTDYIRLHNGEDTDESVIEFAPRQIIQTDKSEVNRINYGYELVTRSGFFNGNDIHLFSSDNISIDEVSKWYK